MTRKEKLTLIATILGSTIVFLDSTVVNVALPTIQEDLDTGLAGQQWVVEAYMLSPGLACCSSAARSATSSAAGGCS